MPTDESSNSNGRHRGEVYARVVIDKATGLPRVLARDEGLLTPTLGRAARRRVASVEPHRFWPRQAFLLLRLVFGEEGTVAAWTRRWPVLWRVNLRLSGGAVYGPFVDREAAVKFEAGWVLRRRIL